MCTGSRLQAYIIRIDFYRDSRRMNIYNSSLKFGETPSFRLDTLFRAR